MPALDRLVTGHSTFNPIGPAHAPLHLFQVTPNIDAAPALSKASDLLAEIRELLLGAALGAPLKGAHAWLCCMHWKAPRLSSMRCIMGRCILLLRLCRSPSGIVGASGAGEQCVVGC